MVTGINNYLLPACTCPWLDRWRVFIPTNTHLRKWNTTGARHHKHLLPILVPSTSVSLNIYSCSSQISRNFSSQDLDPEFTEFFIEFSGISMTSPTQTPHSGAPCNRELGKRGESGLSPEARIGLKIFLKALYTKHFKTKILTEAVSWTPGEGGRGGERDSYKYSGSITWCVWGKTAINILETGKDHRQLCKDPVVDRGHLGKILVKYLVQCSTV